MILIDTNILVYVHDPVDPRRQSVARDLLIKLEAGAGVLSAQCLAEFLSVTTRPARGLPARLAPAEALVQVERLARVFPVLPLTTAVVLEAGRAVRDYRLSYYDAQIWAVAKLNQVPVVLSEDFQDGQVLEGIRFANPFEPGFDLSRQL